MIYTCKACRYTFEGEENITQCPDCGKFAVRIATQEEVAEYKSRAHEEWDRGGMTGGESDQGDA